MCLFSEGEKVPEWTRLQNCSHIALIQWKPLQFWTKPFTHLALCHISKHLTQPVTSPNSRLTITVDESDFMPHRYMDCIPSTYLDLTCGQYVQWTKIYLPVEGVLPWTLSDYPQWSLHSCRRPCLTAGPLQSCTQIKSLLKLTLMFSFSWKTVN